MRGVFGCSADLHIVNVSFEIKNILHIGARRWMYYMQNNQSLEYIFIDEISENFYYANMHFNLCNKQFDKIPRKKPS
jgi:hypothetical protein